MENSKLSRRAFLVGMGGFSALGAAYLAQKKWGWLFMEDALLMNFSHPDLVFTPLDAISGAEPFDVCIIGSGPAGTVLGMDLVKRGYRTVIVESGPELRSQAAASSGDQTLAGQDASGQVLYPLDSTHFRGLGGTSTIWTGRCSRLYPLDFDQNAYTPQGAAWPISYEDIEPYYERAERTLRVSGGRLSKYLPPMKNAFPMPSRSDIHELQAFMQKVSVWVDETPTSTGLNIHNNGPVRVGTDFLPDFSASKNASVIFGGTVTSLQVDSSGRVTAAEVRDNTLAAYPIRARVFVAASGGVENARLLMLSKSSTFPNGIGNDHDLVGRFFMEHPNLNLFGSIPGMAAVRHELGRCHQFYQEFKQRGLGSIILVVGRSSDEPDTLQISVTFEMQPQAENRIRLEDTRLDIFGNPIATLPLTFSEKDQQTMDAGRTLVNDIFQRLGGSFLREDDLSWSHHHLGTCRMGSDPATSVIDGNLKVHVSPNLYVAGSAGFVTAGASHPTVAITALSHRLAEHLDERLQTDLSLRTGILRSAPRLV